jgi:ribosomal protein L37AE/L43A
MSDDTPKPKYNDYPFSVIEEAVREVLKKGDTTIHQKFTCAKCGARQTMEEPNVLYLLGKCEECGHVTDIKAQGCNYLAHFRFGG